LALIYCIAVYLRRFSHFRFDFDYAFIRHAIVEAWPLGAMAICVVVFLRIGTVIVSVFCGDTAVGLYSAAYGLSEMATMVPAILAASLFPIISRYHMSSRPLFVFAFAKSVKLLVYLAVPMALFVTIWAESFVTIVYGSEFAGSVPLLRILIWSAAVMYASITLGVVFVTANLQIINLKINFVTMVINVVLNLLITPVYGIYGTATVFLITESFSLLGSVYALEKLGYNVDIWKIYVIPVIGAIVAGAGYLSMTWLQLNIGLITFLCLAFYAIVVLARGVDKEDLGLFKKVVGPIGRIRGRTYKL
jgi:O-antigen/teichoic acid export membrane protein